MNDSNATVNKENTSQLNQSVGRFRPDEVTQTSYTPGLSQGERRGKHKKLLLLSLTALTLLAIIGGVFAYSTVNKLSPHEMYIKAIENTISEDANKQIYASFDASSDKVKLDGEIEGNLSGSTGKLQANLIADTTQEGVPIKMDMDMRLLETSKVSDGYIRYNNVTSSNTQYNQAVQNYFAPAINKWIKIKDDGQEDTKSDFKKDGPTAAFDVVGLYVPAGVLSKKDETTYLAGIKKYNLFTVADKVSTTKFKGISARALQVSIEKDAFKQFDQDMANSLSKKADYTSSTTRYIDQLFGHSNKFKATIYLSADKYEIIGVEYNVKFDQPIAEETFDTNMTYVKASFLFDNQRNLTIEKPSQYITEEQLGQLLGS